MELERKKKKTLTAVLHIFCFSILDDDLALGFKTPQSEIKTIAPSELQSTDKSEVPFGN